MRLRGAAPSSAGEGVQEQLPGKHQGSARRETEQPQSWERRQEPLLPAVGLGSQKPPQAREGTRLSGCHPSIASSSFWKRTLLPQGRGIPGLGPREWGAPRRRPGGEGHTPVLSQGRQRESCGVSHPTQGMRWGLGHKTPAREESAAPPRVPGGREGSRPSCWGSVLKEHG